MSCAGVGGELVSERVGRDVRVMSGVPVPDDYLLCVTQLWVSGPVSCSSRGRLRKIHTVAEMSEMGHAHSACNCKVPINGKSKAGVLLNAELLMNALQRRISVSSCGVVPFLLLALRKTVRLLVLMKAFQNSMGCTHTKKMCRKFKRGLFFLDPEKLTFGGDFHPAATILCFQLRIHVLRTNWDVAAGIGIWKHSSGAASCPGAPWEKLPPVWGYLQTLGLALECPEPSVPIRGCADPAAVLLSGDRLSVTFPQQLRLRD